MNNRFKLAALGFLIFSACDTKQQTFNLTNSSERSLNSVVAVVQRSAFLNGDGKLPLIKNSKGQVVPVQFDDLDGDGSWEELAFEYDLGPGETLTYSYEYVGEEEYPTFKQRANVHLGYSAQRDNNFVDVTANERPDDHMALSTPYLYQYEGPGWESELVAFRSYFDSRNGKDIFGKTNPGLYVDSIGLGEDYHVLQDWGLDVLKVGNSLGAGALALLKNDSIYRLGETKGAQFQLLTEGPVRAVFTLTYDGWEVDGTSYTLEETITIWGGKRWYESVVRLSGGSNQDTLVTGIVDLKNVPVDQFKAEDWNILSTHGKQSENNDNLGMAILVPDANFAGFDQAPESGEGVTNTQVVYLKPGNNGQYRYIFYAGWEGENPELANPEYFEDQLKNEATQLSKTAKIAWK